MKPSLLDDFRLSVETEELGAYGVHVYVQGQGSVEHRFRSDERTHLFSGSKAFTSMAVGIAQDEGRLSLEDCALSFFPKFAPSAAPGADRITLRDLLHMQAGHGATLFTTDEASQRFSGDWAQAFFQTPQAYAPGAVFLYDNGASYMLSRIIEAVSGQTLRDFLLPRLFAPLGIENPQWHTCPAGHSLGAFGLYLKTEEFSRLGILMLQGGEWKDRQLISSAYLKRAIQDTVTVSGFDDPENNAGYGYQLWSCTLPGVYRADGKYGQYSIVIPEARSVVTITAHNEHNANDLLRAVWRDLLPRL